MASLVGSIRNIMSDSWWIVKVGVFTAVLFFILDQGYHIPPSVPEQTIQMALAVFWIIMLGIAAVAMNRNINNKSPFLPGLFSIHEIIIKGIFAAIALIPGILLAYALYIGLSKITVEQPVVTIIFYVLAAAFVSPFLLIPVVLTSAKGNLFDAFRLNILFGGAGNVMVQILSYIIQYAIIVGAVVAVLYFFILEMLGDHFALLILKAFVLVITFISVFSYASDLYGEAIPAIKEKEIKQKRKVRPMQENTSKNNRIRPGQRPNRPEHRRPNRGDGGSSSRRNTP